MLNELVALERGLAAHGAVAGARHPDITDMAKGIVIRLRLNQEGGLASTELVPPGGRGALWTLRNGKHNGFPGLKTARGLLQIEDATGEVFEKAWREAKSAVQKRPLLTKLLAENPLHPHMDDWPKTGHRRSIAERLQLLHPLAGNPRTAAVPAAFERFLRALDTSPPLLTALADVLARQVHEGDEAWLEPAKMAFTGIVALAIDVEEDRGRFARDAGDPRQIEPVSDALQGGADSSGGATGECALSGPSARLLDGNFPPLPRLGQTYLFARNPDIPAMARYSRDGAASMPIDAGLVARLSGAISALLDEQRQGKTWRWIPTEAGDKPDLFVASLPSNPDMPLADLMASEETEDGWSMVETSAESMLRLLDGRLSSANPQAELQLLILRIVDRGNSKAVYDRRTNVAALHGYALAWDRAMRNTPEEIEFLVRTKKGMVVRGPFAQSPLSLVRLSRRLCASGGTRLVDVVGVPASEAFGLFLRDGDVAGRARRILALLLQRHQTMIAALVQSKMRGTDDLKGFDPKAELRGHALRSIAWIGALLHILGRPKERYMDDAGFKLGQLLAAADAVHIGYCADLRGGQVPPTLLGNAVFAIASRHPVRALEILQTRWKPYGAWAKRADQVHEKANKLMGGKDERLGWHMRHAVSQARLAGEICAELKSRLGELGQPDERFRAELLLGYVAGAKREQDKAGTARAANDANGDIE